MNAFVSWVANAPPATPDSRGHDLTWPYWVGVLLAALLVVVIPFILGRRSESGRRKTPLQ